MSRHRTSVPTSFYHRFSVDVARFAQTYSNGKVVAVLEGGYTQRALASGTMAMLIGLVGDDGMRVDGEEAAEWWKVGELEKMEKACSPSQHTASTTQRRGKLFSGPIFPATSTAKMAGAKEKERQEEEWIRRTVEIYRRLEGIGSTSPSTISSVRSPAKAHAIGVSADVGRTMQLRGRRSKGEELTPTASPVAVKASTSRSKKVVITPVVLVAPIAVATEEVAVVQFIKQEESLTPSITVVEETKKFKFVWREGGL